MRQLLSAMFGFGVRSGVGRAVSINVKCFAFASLAHSLVTVCNDVLKTQAFYALVVPRPLGKATDEVEAASNQGKLGIDVCDFAILMASF